MTKFAKKEGHVFKENEVSWDLVMFNSLLVLRTFGKDVVCVSNP